MLRKDGTFIIYKIQHQWDLGGEWFYSAYVDYAETRSRTDKFSASGRCWQETGEHGVYKLSNAITGLKAARKAVAKDFKNKKLTRKIPLRIVKVTITQKTEPVVAPSRAY
jgi:hypothetical protein